MYTRCVFSVFFVLIAFFCLFIVYQPHESIVQLIGIGLQVTIAYLTDLQLFLRQQVIQPTQSNVCQGDCKTAEVINNSDPSQSEHECPHHRYTTRIIERKPLIIYIEQFLTRNEIQHLIKLTEPFFEPSKVYDVSGELNYDEYRTSSSVNIKRHQTPTVKCIEQRFAQFQGDIDIRRIEPFQIVKYTPDQQFKPNFDWFSQPDQMTNGGQRVTTFVTYLQANCSMGETEFLEIQFDKSLHGQFCDILICDEKSAESGIRFRPLPGNSIFWSNIDEDGQVEYLTYHAGRPPGENGHKIVLNTWTRADRFFVSPKK